MVENALRTYGYEPDADRREDLHRVPQDPQRRRLRRLPAGRPGGPQEPPRHRPAGRLRPGPHHRRLPSGRAVRRRPADRREGLRARRAATRCGRPRTSSATARSCPSRSARWGSSATMAASYGYDISGPATTAREAVQWLYFAYLAAVKEQNGAAMSLGRTSTFLDVYLERDLADRRARRGRGAGAGRRLRHQAADRPLPAHPGVRRPVLRRPDVGHRVHRRPGRRRPSAGHPDVASATCRRSTTWARRRSRTSPCCGAPRCRRASSGSARRSPSTPPRSSTSPTSCCAASAGTTPRSRAASRG